MVKPIIYIYIWTIYIYIYTHYPYIYIFKIIYKGFIPYICFFWKNQYTFQNSCSISRWFVLQIPEAFKRRRKLRWFRAWGQVTVSDFSHPQNAPTKNPDQTHTIHGNCIFTYIFMLDFYGFHGWFLWCSCRYNIPFPWMLWVRSGLDTCGNLHQKFRWIQNVGMLGL